MSFQQSASQTVGPYFIIGLGAGVVTDLTGPQVRGERITLHGQVLDGNGVPVNDAVIETWQADADGRFPETAHDAPPPAFGGFARLPTDAEGRFTLVTVRPGRVADCSARMQAPHLSVNVFMRGMLKHAYTRLYLPDEAEANARDPVLALVPEARRPTLVATGSAADGFHWTLRMQGPQETVFFDY
ncbi:protocatechuate 3,4-dioxygenase subunit alpha [Stigmatella aurantiaca]|uniref:Protocatechuate 3,4-dioxygenase, alpha subunit n=1 Tax=Stigmatella aurantiaca (strain DW4/3-1) TaxID=378806 RepID=E3FJ46_STIAD|nr:protocatechuate 3,4-dioxygenase subunit alpha [Stigmatella aurantiaca]ADO69141.1 Protocatechuate 3,4-dioxygenase, alpha subunit [Stigmatella aurantiaca DW4/3-1]